MIVGMGSDGGILPGGVTGTTALGISSVWRCLDILANGVSQLEWQERRGNLDLPASPLVRRPQSQRTRREWTSIVVSTLALYDVCYLLKADRDEDGYPRSLLYCQPYIVQPKSEDMFSVFLPDTYYLLGRPIPADDLVVLHRSPQPLVWDTMGGVVQMARATFAAAISAENYASRYWQAGGAPTSVLETDAVLDQTKADDLSDRWYQRRAKGPDYAPVLSSGLKAKAFGADITAESAVEARREMVADVGRYFGIGPDKLNAPAADDQTYKSSEPGNQDLIRYTLQNYIGAIQDAVTDNLPGGRHMVMDTWRLLQPGFLAQAQAYQLAVAGKAWMSPEDVRDALGLPPIEDPDELNPPPPVPVITGELP
jgi:phage portal protein BeeE